MRLLWLLGFLLGFNSPLPDVTLEPCLHPVLGKSCPVKVTVTGYPVKKFKLYCRESNGLLVPLSEGKLDQWGKASFNLIFNEISNKQLVIILFNSNDVPVALDSAAIIIYPPNSQLGEQVPVNILHLPSDSSEEESEGFGIYD